MRRGGRGRGGRGRGGRGRGGGIGTGGGGRGGSVLPGGSRIRRFIGRSVEGQVDRRNGDGHARGELVGW